MTSKNFRTILILLPFLIYASMTAMAQSHREGSFDEHQDIGNPKIIGNIKFDSTDQSYWITAGGYNIWFNRDEFHYAFKKISGDFILTANFEFDSDNAGNAHKKMGWMIRESLDESSASISACTHRDGLTVLQWRGLRGAYMRDPEDEIPFPKKGYGILQLERTGKRITMRVAHFGEPLQVVGYHDMLDLKDTVYAGIYLCAHDSNTLAKAKIWNVRFDKPVPTNYKPEQEGWLGSRMEILNISNGFRRVIHESPTRFEAPNWLPDGKRLLYNQDGSIFTIPFEGGLPQKLNTGTVALCNNDHGISFDGKTLAISSGSHELGPGGSRVYVLPLQGGEPKLITTSSPSYWHGWSPNGKEVLFVGMRKEKVFNLYKISLAGGPEVPLTNLQNGHVDGPEYSPDGSYIYYNGNQTGTMQIWRMKPDGSNKEQLTFDEYHNWFPHVSPDGKWIIFISFPIDIDPNSHPSFKQVMLRLMPLNGAGSPRVLAYIYGGQGTINVPSWSPDSKQLAFVSNSQRF